MRDTPLRRSRGLRVRSLLMLVVLVPTLGMAAMAATSASEALDKHDASHQVAAATDRLAAIVDARVDLADEETLSTVLSLAADLGIDSVALNEFYGVNVNAAIEVARAGVDSNATVESVLALADGGTRLRTLRASMDAGTATYDQVRELFDDLMASIDGVWVERFAALHVHLGADEFASSTHDRVDAVRASFDALSWGSRRAALTVQLLLGESGPETLALLLDASSRHRFASETFADVLGPAAAEAWAQHEADPGTRRLEGLLDQVTTDSLASSVPVRITLAKVADGFTDGTAWSARLSNLVRVAAGELRQAAAHDAHAATADLRNQVVVTGILALLAVTGALLLARSLTRPARRLQAAAHEIHLGQFNLDPIDTSGPRELADTAAAFNEMATTLAAVESHAVALADDPDAPQLSDELPGRTGRALQVALNRLRASIRGAEQHRRELETAATHDGLTGLLNRTAALVMIERDLARTARTNDVMMALFVDLDGLKAINDEHGHAAGDDAIRLTSEALRAATRQSDVIARLGGDEFLVAGIIDDRREAERLADRIRVSLASQVLVGTSGRIPLHCSIGMALSGPRVATVDALIQRSDWALYLAKRQGRDQAAWDDQHGIPDHAPAGG